MFEHSRPAWIEINLDNLIHNMKEIRRVAKSNEKRSAFICHS